MSAHGGDVLFPRLAITVIGIVDHLTNFLYLFLREHRIVVLINRPKKGVAADDARLGVEFPEFGLGRKDKDGNVSYIREILQQVFQSLDVTFILDDRIIETTFLLENDLCAIAASFITKNPTIIILGFYNKYGETAMWSIWIELPSS